MADPKLLKLAFLSSAPFNLTLEKDYTPKTAYKNINRNRSNPMFVN